MCVFAIGRNRGWWNVWSIEWGCAGTLKVCALVEYTHTSAERRSQSVVVNVISLQAEAERRKRAAILDSEAEQLSEINIAEGRKKAQVLASEGALEERMNAAKGEAFAIQQVILDPLPCDCLHPPEPFV